MWQFYGIDMSRCWEPVYDVGTLIVLVENLRCMPGSRVHWISTSDGEGMPGWGAAAENMAQLWELLAVVNIGEKERRQGNFPRFPRPWDAVVEREKNKPVAATIADLDVGALFERMS